MTMTENIKKFSEEVEKDAALLARIEALEGRDDAVEQVIAIAKEYGYTLTEEELNALTEEDFNESASAGGSVELSLDDLDSAAGGNLFGLRMIVRDMRSQSQLREARERGMRQ